MLRVAAPTAGFILEQPPEAQLEILRALRTIEAQPLSGDHLPFPWVPGLRGYTTLQYFITYRLTDGIPEVAGVTKMPTADDVRRTLK